MTAVRVSVADGRRCPRCSAALCLTASSDSGLPCRTVALCPGCDADNPDARRLLDYLAAHPTVLPQDRALVSDLLGRWLGSLAERKPATTSLADAAATWWAARQRTGSATDTSAAAHRCDS